MSEKWLLGGTMRFALIGAASLLLWTGMIQAQEETEAPLPLRAALFVQNRAGNQYQDKVDVLNDMITVNLTEKGFSVVDKADAISRFRESRNETDSVKKALSVVADVVQTGKSEAAVEDAVSGAAALRIANHLDADYLIMASLNSVGNDYKRFDGKGTIYGVSTETNVVTLRVALKVLEGNSGGSIAGDMVTVSESIQKSDMGEIASSDVVNRLLERAAKEIADKVGKKIERIRNTVVKAPNAVTVTVTTNVPGATVEADGAVLGTTPATLALPPGLHTVRLSREYFATWEKTVNIHEGQQLNVTLEFSEEGSRRYQSLEKFKAEMAMAQEANSADAKAKVLQAEGQKKMLENSHIQFEGKLDSLSIGDTKGATGAPGVVVQQQMEVK